jgi:hypothetical protein
MSETADVEDEVATFLVTGWGDDYYVAYNGFTSLGESALVDEVAVHNTEQGAIDAWRAMMREKRAV